MLTAELGRAARRGLPPPEPDRPPARRLKARAKIAGVSIVQWEARLWGPYPTASVAELKRKLRRKEGAEKASGHWLLARRAADRGEIKEALAALRSVPANLDQQDDPLARQLLELDLHRRAGTLAGAFRAIRQAVRGKGWSPQLALAGANAVGLALAAVLPPRRVDRARLRWLNLPYCAAGVAPLRLRDPAKGLSIANVRCDPLPPAAGTEAARISVLIPAFNAAATLPFTIESVLAQSWANLEVIVVDDCSDDATREVVASFANRDPRVRLVRHERNAGAYAAQNTGLRHASGDIIVTHGADDWSHPQRLELQVRPMLAGQHRCTATYGARVLDDLTVMVRARTATPVFVNVSSYMFRKADIEALGGWDEVRMEADLELYRRFKVRWGVPAGMLLPGVPMSLILSRADSLTGMSLTGMASQGYGARREYREAYAHWHRSEAARDATQLALPRSGRAFPAPGIVVSRSLEHLSVDILLVSDYSLQGAATDAAMALSRAAASENLSTAILHWPTFEGAGLDAIDAARRWINEGPIRSIVPGESVTCRVALFTQPEALLGLPEVLPQISAVSAVIALPKWDALTPQQLDEGRQNVIRAVGAEPRLQQWGGSGHGLEESTVDLLRLALSAE